MRHTYYLLGILTIIGCSPATIRQIGGEGERQPPIGEPLPEICSNGADDNRNGEVDEGCGCDAGASQRCFLGPPALDDVAGTVPRAVGICTLGTQVCSGGSQEFPVWGPCTGAVAPRVEICGDGVDQDCDGADLLCEGTPPETCETFTIGESSRPVDIVWAIDNSNSMDEQNSAVRNGINAFVDYIDQAGVDHHVMMITEFNLPPEPLRSSASYQWIGDAVDVPSRWVGNHNALQRFQQHIGWMEGFMRPNSLRHFIVVTDDRSEGVTADQFDSFLRSRDGYDDYVFHSVVGLYGGGCVEHVGHNYMSLSDRTGGVKFHVCNGNWQELFDAVGEIAIEAVGQLQLIGPIDDRTLSVRENGTVLQQGTDWTYDSLAELLLLSDPVPEVGSEIVVCHR